MTDSIKASIKRPAVEFKVGLLPGPASSGPKDGADITDWITAHSKTAVPDVHKIVRLPEGRFTVAESTFRYGNWSLMGVPGKTVLDAIGVNESAYKPTPDANSTIYVMGVAPEDLGGACTPLTGIDYGLTFRCYRPFEIRHLCYGPAVKNFDFIRNTVDAETVGDFDYFNVWKSANDPEFATSGYERGEISFGYNEIDAGHLDKKGGEGISVAALSTLNDAGVYNPDAHVANIHAYRNIIRNTGDDPIAYHGALDSGMAHNKCYTSEGRLLFTGGRGFYCIGNHLEWIRQRNNEWSSLAQGIHLFLEQTTGGAGLPCEDFQLIKNRMVVPDGLTADAGYAIRVEGGRRGILWNNVCENNSPTYQASLTMQSQVRPGWVPLEVNGHDVAGNAASFDITHNGLIAEGDHPENVTQNDLSL